MTPLRKIVLDVFEKVSMYIEYLTAQKERVNKCHTYVERTTTGAPVDLFLIQNVKQFCGTNENFSSSFSKICTAMETFGVYKHILLNDFFVLYSRLEFTRTIRKLSEKGFPCISPEYDMYYYALPSHGPHRGQHFIWKQPRGDDSSAEQQQLVDTIREESTTTEQPSVKFSTSFIDWEL